MPCKFDICQRFTIRVQVFGSLGLECITCMFTSGQTSLFASHARTDFVYQSEAEEAFSMLDRKVVRNIIQLMG